MPSPLLNVFSDLEGNLDFFNKLALALLIGVLIGIERERKSVQGRVVLAGVRTFSITCIAGMLSSYISLRVGISFLLFSLAFFVVFVLFLVYIKNVIYDRPGMTGPVALLSTFFIGVMIGLDLYLPAIASGVVITMLLAEKKPLHSFAVNLSYEEIIGAVRFLAVAFILYPITDFNIPLPFLEMVNLQKVLLIVIFVESIGFVSFIAMKKMDPAMGVPVSGMLGGLVNSEATTGALAGIAKRRLELVDSCFLGVVLANATMLLRNLAIGYVVDPTGRILILMAPPIFLLSLVSFASALKVNPKACDGEAINLESPFNLLAAVKFAVGFTLIFILSSLAQRWGGVLGFYTVSLGGLVSSAVVTASVSMLAVDGVVSFRDAAVVAVLASIFSTGSKIAMVRFSGPKQLARKAARHFTLLIVLGLLGLLAWNHYYI